MSEDGKDTKHVSCLNCFKRAPLFNMLTIEELNNIECHRTEVTFNKGELIHKSGTQSSHVISFNAGLAKLYLEDHKGSIK